jgi:hypothetical protein
MSFLGNLFTPQAGGSPAGNILRGVLGTSGHSDTANALGGLVGNLIGGGSGSSGSSLPSWRDILEGAGKGATDTVLNSEAGQEAQKQAALSYWRSNMFKVFTVVLGVAAIVFGFIALKRR